MMEHLPLLMIGCGNMGRPILSAILSAGVPVDKIAVIVRGEESRKELESLFPSLRILTGSSLNSINKYLAKTIVYAAKPQEIAQGILLPYLSNDRIAANALFVSIAAGLPIKLFKDKLGTPNIIRTMPNTPAQIGHGVTALYSDSQVRNLYGSFVEKLFTTTGKTLWMEHEALMHVVTAVSGSGPAYVFHLLECMGFYYPGSAVQEIKPYLNAPLRHSNALAMPAKSLAEFCELAAEVNKQPASVIVPAFRDSWIEAAPKIIVERVSLTSEQANALVSQTLIGTIALAEHSGLPFATLRANVTSKKGTTEAGLNVLMGNSGKTANNFKELLFNTIAAATRRSQELAG